ncbi:DUF2179 domain-containing protein [Marinisporobacter balticus]|uniref:UPF0316 protein EV214_12935 n=1 Tax=Marinisporobacter balticus TaxID=2018667 RepID=A0A4R2KH91_9FIRM|nr:DUF2179 domain-containing protein [Marinisporobacter balticus]TCO69856.1 uncharacterized protein YebE (UPF0316 family) [Marinisporobacter balticus]
MGVFLGYLLIAGSRVADVSISVIRTILLVRGKKYQAAALGVVEILIYIFVLQKIMTQLNDIGNLIAYALGFGTGQIVGVYLEQKMAIGDVTAQVITKEDETGLVEVLRNEGFGVTVIQGYGRDGIRYILNIVLQRNMLPKLNKLLNQFDKGAFITIMDTKHIRGGYLKRMKRK